MRTAGYRMTDDMPRTSQAVDRLMNGSDLQASRACQSAGHLSFSLGCAVSYNFKLLIDGSIAYLRVPGLFQTERLMSSSY